MYYSILSRTLIKSGDVRVEVSGPDRERSILRYSGRIVSGSGDSLVIVVSSDPIYPSEESARLAMESIIKKVREE